MSLDVGAFLKEHHPFTLLTEVERDRVAAATRSRIFADGARVLQQGGEQSEWLYLVAAGEALLVRDGEELQILEQGDCFGYPSSSAGCCTIRASRSSSWRTWASACSDSPAAARRRSRASSPPPWAPW